MTRPIALIPLVVLLGGCFDGSGQLAVERVQDPPTAAAATYPSVWEAVESLAIEEARRLAPDELHRSFADALDDMIRGDGSQAEALDNRLAKAIMGDEKAKGFEVEGCPAPGHAGGLE